MNNIKYLLLLLLYLPLVFAGGWQDMAIVHNCTELPDGEFDLSEAVPGFEYGSLAARRAIRSLFGSTIKRHGGLASVAACPDMATFDCYVKYHGAVASVRDGGSRSVILGRGHSAEGFAFNDKDGGLTIAFWASCNKSF